MTENIKQVTCSRFQLIGNAAKVVKNSKGANEVEEECKENNGKRIESTTCPEYSNAPRMRETMKRRISQSLRDRKSKSKIERQIWRGENEGNRTVKGKRRERKGEQEKGIVGAPVCEDYPSSSMISRQNRYSTRNIIIKLKQVLVSFTEKIRFGWAPVIAANVAIHICLHL